MKIKRDKNVPRNGKKLKDSAEGAARSPRRQIILRDARDVRRLLSSLINRVLWGDIAVDRVRCAIYASQALLSCFDQQDIEERIAALEAAIKEGAGEW
jgi:hypothetical protein